MNLAKKYKQLFEGKVKSNDTALIKEGKKINEMRPPGNLTRTVDHTTMNLKSDIAKKWEDGEDMEDDLVQWFDASVKASGPDLGEELIYRLESTLKRFEKINDAYLR